MYRGRVGYEASPKPSLRLAAISANQQHHASKLALIASRLSGSGTVDCNAPVSSKMKHLMKRQKQRAMVEQRNDEIASENR